MSGCAARVPANLWRRAAMVWHEFQLEPPPILLRGKCSAASRQARLAEAVKFLAVGAMCGSGPKRTAESARDRLSGGWSGPGLPAVPHLHAQSGELVAQGIRVAKSRATRGRATLQQLRRPPAARPCRPRTGLPARGPARGRNRAGWRFAGAAPGHRRQFIGAGHRVGLGQGCRQAECRPSAFTKRARWPAVGSAARSTSAPSVAPSACR